MISFEASVCGISAHSSQLVSGVIHSYKKSVNISPNIRTYFLFKQVNIGGSSCL